MKISGAIFDLDGTLLDSMAIWQTIDSDYIRSKGLVPEKNLSDKLINTTIRQAAQYFKNNYPLTEGIDTIIDEINNMTEDFYINEAPLKEGVADFLKHLKICGVKMCVATATDRHLAQAALKRNGVLDCFDGVFTCSEAGHSKNEPHIFREAIDFLGTEKDSTWVFEDASHAITTAKKEGFKICGIYDKWAKDAEIIQAASDIYLKTFCGAVQYFG